MALRKAVIPVAGLGTRFLPATKVVPKELLPVVDTPALEYVVAEAVDAGLEDILLITGRGKEAIVEHFKAAPALEQALRDNGDTQRLAAVQRSSHLGQIHTVRQGQPRGLGHAVLCAKDHVGNQPFAVLLGDDLIDARDKHLRAMLRVQELLGGSVIALMRVPLTQIAMYGMAAVRAVAPGLAAQAGLAEGQILAVEALVEKPQPDQVRSDMAVIGRYVLDPLVFEVLEQTPPGRGGEIQLTDAIARLAETPVSQGGGVHGVVFSGRRYDTGDRLDYLKATVRLAAERPDLGPPFKVWLSEFVAEITALDAGGGRGNQG